MSEAVNMEKAREVYDTIISMFDNRDLKYDKFEEDLVIKSGFQSDDFPVKFIVVVNPNNEVVQFISPLPFNVPEDMRIDAALAVAVANYGLVDGSFDYDLGDGEIRFRLTSSYRNSTLSEELFAYMVMVAASTVDKYNDRFFMLVKNMINLQQFIDQEKAD